MGTEGDAPPPIELALFVDERRPAAATALALSDTLLAALTAVVRGARQASELIAVGTTFRLRLPPALAADVASGKLSMMQAAAGGVRSAIVDERATIVGSGAFHAIAAAPLVAAAVWQLAAKITANHFLAEIDANLASIDAKLDALLHALHDAWKGELHGSARKLASVARELLEHELSERELQGFQVAIETIDTSARGITARAQLRSARALARVRTLDPKVTTTSERLDQKTDALAELLREIDDSAAQEYFALYVRVLAAQVRCGMPSSPATTRTRLHELEGELRDATARNERVLDLARERIAWLEGLLTREATDDKHRRALLEQRRTIVLRGQQLAVQVGSALTTVQARLDGRLDQELWVTMGAEGKVAAAHVAPVAEPG